MMYMITGLSVSPNVYTLRFFNEVEEVQKYLDALRRFDAHSMAPRCFKIQPGEKAEEMSKEWCKKHIWPYTQFNKEYQARQEDLTRTDR